MRKILVGLFAFMVLALVVNPQAFAHTLFMMVEDNENGTVSVKGGIFNRSYGCSRGSIP